MRSNHVWTGVNTHYYQWGSWGPVWTWVLCALCDQSEERKNSLDLLPSMPLQNFPWHSFRPQPASLRRTRAREREREEERGEPQKVNGIMKCQCHMGSLKMRTKFTIWAWLGMSTQSCWKACLVYEELESGTKLLESLLGIWRIGIWDKAAGKPA